MERAYKFRIYPNQQQRLLLAKTFGCVRFVYNYYLDKRIKLYKESEQYFGFYDCSKDLTFLKQELEWLKEPDKCSLQNTLKDLEAAYKNFFKMVLDSQNLNLKKIIINLIEQILAMEILNSFQSIFNYQNLV